MGGYIRKLQDYSDEELKEIPYAALCALRREAYAAHIADMPSEPTLVDWAGRMAKKHGAKVRIWAHEVDWIMALMIARYGEALNFWPNRFSQEDLDRAYKWETQAYGSWPIGTQPIL